MNFSFFRAYAILALFLLLIIPGIAKADIAVPGTKEIDWCYQLENMRDYPEHVFLYYDENVSSYAVIQPDECFDFYKGGLVTIYAIKRVDFHEEDLNQEFFEQPNPNVFSSNLKLEGYGLVKKNDPLEKAVTMLAIEILNDSRFELQKIKIIYSYTDGTTEEKFFDNDQNVPAPSKKAVFPWWMSRVIYLGIPLVAAVIIVAVLVRKKFK